MNNTVQVWKDPSLRQTGEVVPAHPAGAVNLTAELPDESPAAMAAASIWVGTLSVPGYPCC